MAILLKNKLELALVYGYRVSVLFRCSVWSYMKTINRLWIVEVLAEVSYTKFTDHHNERFLATDLLFLP